MSDKTLIEKYDKASHDEKRKMYLIALSMLTEYRKSTDDLRGRNQELEQLFDLQHRRIVKADELWRAAHPGNDNIVPDLGRLIDWLLDRHATPPVANANAQAVRELREIVAEWRKDSETYDMDTGDIGFVYKWCADRLDAAISRFSPRTASDEREGQLNK